MSEFEIHLAISAMLRNEKPDTRVPFSHAVKAYEDNQLPPDEAKPPVLYGEILPPDPLDELFEVAGWNPDSTPRIEKLLIEPEQPWEGYAAQRKRIFGME